MRNMKVITISATKAAVREYLPGEWSPYPFDAKPAARSNPCVPLAIT
jgi:hypothetical protein